MPDTARTKLLTEGTLLIFLRGLDGVTAILLLVFPVLHLRTSARLISVMVLKAS